MNPSQEKADALRKAADAVEVAAAANAVAAQAQAQAEAIAANATAQQSLANANADKPAVPVVTQHHNLDFDRGHGHGGNNGYYGGAGASNGPVPANGQKGIEVGLWAIVAAILAVALIAWLAWLTAGKADNQRVDQLHGVVASANATANIADIKATEAKKDAATAISTATTAGGKADSAASKADEALRKAQAALDAKPEHGHKRQKPMITERRPEVRPTQPNLPTGGVIPDGGCVLVANKDGATLKQGGRKLGQGEQVVKIYNTEINSSADSLLVDLRKQFPNWLSSKPDHQGLCLAWRKATAEKLVLNPGNLN